MKKVIYNVAAESGGALTILNEYYSKASMEKNIEWVFIISTPSLSEKSNIKVLNYPWIKKSWLHRLFFEYFMSKKIIEKEKPDEVISLQNIIIKNLKRKQTVYLHQALPFISRKYRVDENLKFWIYQNIISRMIFTSLKKADKVIVQSEWLKRKCVTLGLGTNEKYIVEKPSLNIGSSRYREYKKGKKVYFYPAAPLEYKNHKMILEALKNFTDKEKQDIEVMFTFEGDENKVAKEIKQIVNKERLPVRFVGMITKEEVYSYYRKSTLIFTSTIESFGLPLLEAKYHNTPIISLDHALYREVLEGYKKVIYFEKNNLDKLINIMKNESLFE